MCAWVICIRSECINPSVTACVGATSLYKGGLGGEVGLPQANAEGLAVGIAGGILCIAICR